MNEKRFKDEKSCSNCRNQMTGWDGGFFGLPFTCECRIYGETENRKNCSYFEKKITKSYLLDKIKELEKENEQLKQYKQSVNDVLKSWSQKNLTAKQLQVVLAIMEELNVIGDVE